MKTILLALSLCCCLCGCTAESEQPINTVEHTTYFQSGRYYITADEYDEVVTNDGNIWAYTQTIISDKPSYHNEPIIAAFDDNGTPDDIYDDEILGLVLDRETAIYDALEDSLSESFELERDGNNIRIQALKEAD